MIQLALNVEDSSASTLHVDLGGAPGLFQESRLLTELRPKYISTCVALLTSSAPSIPNATLTKDECTTIGPQPKRHAAV